jgi:hypothetical protein
VEFLIVSLKWAWFEMAQTGWRKVDIISKKTVFEVDHVLKNQEHCVLKVGFKWTRTG